MRLANSMWLVPLAACSPSAPSQPEADAAAAETSAATLAPAPFQSYVERRDDGLRVEVFAPGDGPAITASSRVTLHYNALLPEAAKPFDTTRETGIPLELDLSGASGPKPIRGLALGLIGLKRGSKAKLTVPPALAWGEAGNPAGGVPEKSDVIYSVEILEVR
ncbi:MAG: FKBP-type peptidyl-prolyl cis-trans isomerase [Planctomycetes bacterium]|nr:FKBP-type peptidyl-prolyl cis-trans isomerase [Planctomycetota bacterium]